MTAFDEANGGYRVSPQQLRIWRFGGEAVAVLDVVGVVDDARLQAAVHEVVERHEILRTRCSESADLGVPMQVISEDEPVLTVHVDGDPECTRVILRLAAASADSTTLEIVAAEVAAVYSGRADELAPQPLQYADLAGWLNDLAEDDDTAEAAVAYWRAIADEARTATHGFAAEDATSEPPSATGIAVPLDDAVREGMQNLAVDVEALCRAALLASLWRMTSEDTLVFAEVLPGRSFSDLDSACGPLARHIPVVMQVDPRSPLLAWASQAAEACAGAAQWQDYFSHLRFDADAPGVVFEALGPAPLLALGDDLRADLGVRVAHVDRFALKAVSQIGADGLQIHVFHDGLEDVASRLAAMLGAVLTSAVSQPDHTAVQDLAFFSEHEAAEAVELGRGSALAEAPSCLHDALHAQACRTPERTAVVCGEVVLSFAELDAHSDAIARALAERGVRRGDLVGVLTAPSADLVATLFGIQKAGAAYVPLDGAAPLARIAAAVADAGICLLVVDPEHTAPPGISTWWVDELSDTSGGPLPTTDPADAAYAIYTSGSSGAPKAVVIEHRNTMALREAMSSAVRELAEAEEPLAVALNAVVTFDASVQQLVTLLDGHTLHVLPDAVRRDDALLVEYVRRHRIDVLNGTPTQIDVLVTAGLLDGDQAPRALLVAGEELRPRLWVRLADAPQTAAYNIYGPTECTVNATATLIQPDALPSIGRPLPGYDTFVLDERLRPMPANCPGEIFIAGAGVARGYLHRPGTTAERFMPNPWGPPGSRIYRTGDRARRLLNGDLAFIGRLDTQVKLRGYRIELGEIEATLVRHASVRDAVATVAMDDYGDAQIVAYWVPAAKGCADELRTFLAETLPPYMIPAAFVVLDRLPQTTTGKIDRRALPAPTACDGRSTAYVAPRSPAEARLAAIWSDVLGRERVGIDDGFFAIGGDSIRSIRIRNRAVEYGLYFTVQQLFEYQTIRDLTALCMSGEGMAADIQLPPFALAPSLMHVAGAEDAFPIASMQLSMLFHDERNPSLPMFRNTRTLRLRGRLDEGALREAVRQCAKRHPALRTTFDLAGYAEPVQVVRRGMCPSVSMHDIRGLGPDEQAGVLSSFVAADRAKRFDWSSEPLIRLAVHLLAEDEFQCSITLHEAVLDGWSVATLLNELFRRYVALLEGDPLPVGAPLPSYGAFVFAEQETASNSGHAAFWREASASGIGIVRPERGGRDQAVSVPVPRSISDGLHALARELGIPLKSVLLAVHVRVIATLAGASDMRTGLVANGRLEAEAGDQILGQFLNTLPLRVRLSDDTWRELAQRVFAEELRIMPHRRYPVALMESEAGGPLFDTAFNFTHFHVHQGTVSDLLSLVDDDFHELTDLALLADFSIEPEVGSVRLSLATTGLSDEEAAGVARLYAHAMERAATDPDSSCDAAFGDCPRSAQDDVSADVVAAFRAAAATHPDTVAVSDARSRINYAELDRRSQLIASRLTSAGVGADDVVSLRGRRGAGMIAALLGVLRAGAAFLVLDHENSDSEERVLRRAQPRVILDVDDRAGEGVTPVRGQDADTDSRALAYLVATSGTTGEPKLVMVERGGLANHLRAKAEMLGLSPGTVVAQTARMRFDISVWQCLAALTAGGTVAVIPDEDAADPSRLFVGLAAAGATHAQAVPSLLAAALSGPRMPLPSLRVMVSTADVLSPTTAQAWYERYPQTALYNAYGPAEGTDQVAGQVVSSPTVSCPIGTALPGVVLEVLDDRHCRLPFPAVGTLHVGGDQVARGYLGDPATTAERFTPDPFGYGARLYRTGDVVRMRADGNLELLGRRDRQLQVNGVRIESAEIEAVLARMPGVREVTVAPVRHGPVSGVVAFVAREGTPVTETDVLRRARSLLPRPAVPRRVVFVEALPRTTAGTVDRTALAKAARLADGLGGIAIAPRTDTERLLLEIWKEVLGHPGIGVEDDLFATGGDSISALRIGALAREMYGFRISVADVLERRTIRELADISLARWQ